MPELPNYATVEQRLSAVFSDWGLTLDDLKPLMGVMKMVLGGSIMTQVALGESWPDSDVDFFVASSEVAATLTALIVSKGVLNAKPVLLADQVNTENVYDRYIVIDKPNHTWDWGQNFSGLELADVPEQPLRPIAGGPLYRKL